MRAALILPCLLAACAVAPPVCAPQGAWVSPSSLRPVADPVPGAARHRVVLLGEQHDRAEDHRFELATIRRLYAADPHMALGFEMFARSAQPVLDQWVQGGLTEAQFLDHAQWKQFWGFAPAFYLPIFRFARDHRIAMLALNVSRRLVHLTAQAGWDNVPSAAREGVGKPAPPSQAYRASLAEAMAGHGGPAMTTARLAHFIEAQTVWDRAMAQAIAAALAADPARHVVAIMGAGHLENRDGVPNQLTALGVPNVVVLLPAHALCKPEPPAYADAIFTD